MTNTTTMRVYVKGVEVFAYVRMSGDFTSNDVEVEVKDESVDNRWLKMSIPKYANLTNARYELVQYLETVGV